MIDQSKIKYTVPIYQEHLTPRGHLPREHAAAASAAWQIAGLCHIALEKVPEQVAYEGEKDQTVHLRRIAEGIAITYSLTLQEIMKFMPACRAEAFRLSRAWNPQFQSWLDSGGTSFNTVTRVEGSWGGTEQ